MVWDYNVTDKSIEDLEASEDDKPQHTWNTPWISIYIFETNVAVSIEHFFLKARTRNSMAGGAAEWKTESWKFLNFF